MIFESRELKPYGEYMKSVELIEAQIYFRVSFLDEEMLTPEMVPLVFIGRDLQPDGPGLEPKCPLVNGKPWAVNDMPLSILHGGLNTAPFCRCRCVPGQRGREWRCVP